jgi:hypothetical protein
MINYSNYLISNKKNSGDENYSKLINEIHILNQNVTCVKSLRA